MPNNLIKFKQIDGLEQALTNISGELAVDSAYSSGNASVFTFSGNFNFPETGNIIQMSGAIVGNLPDFSSVPVGKNYYVKNIHPSATGFLQGDAYIEGTGVLEIFPREGFKVFRGDQDWLIL